MKIHIKVDILLFLLFSIVFSAYSAYSAGTIDSVKEPQDGVYLIRDTELGASWTEVYRDGKEVIIVERGDYGNDNE